MSLATRCTSCKTVFRVVQDQLKVSEGWVRCGRCGTVFNALEALFDLERDTPAKWQASQPGAIDGKKTARESQRSKPTTAASSSKSKSKSERGERERDREASRTKPASEPAFFARRRSVSTPGQPDAKAEGHEDFADAQFDADVVAHVPEAEATEPLPLHELPTPPHSNVDTDTTIAGTESPRDDVDEDYQPATHEFVRVAERQAKWREPRVRMIVASLSAALTLALMLQVMHHFRDITAARWPQTAPLLVRWCQTFQCQLQAPRRIDNVSVESTSLTRSDTGANTYLLSVILRNHGRFAVAVPTLDLSLRDASEQLITRRMLKPQDLQAKATVIEPDSEIQLQVNLTEKDQHIDRYTVEAFYH